MSEEKEPVKTWSFARSTVLAMFGFILIFFIIHDKYVLHMSQRFGDFTHDMIRSNTPQSNADISVSDQHIPHIQRSLTVDHEYCASHYNDRRYFTREEAEAVPPILYSFPGSGNTWTRLLIDHATGVFTGSIYDDKSLYAALPGEPSCNRHVSAIKIHPFTPFRTILSPTSSVADTCRNMIFNRAILLIRDPYYAFWSEYERRKSRSHVTGIKREDYSEDDWRKASWAMARQYNEMWVNDYKQVEKEYGKENVLYARFEDLTSSTTRIDTLESMVKLIGINQPRERIECAFYLADDTNAHRVRSDDEMTIDEVYDEDLICRMWEFFGSYASKRGYEPYGGLACEQE